MPMSFSLFSYIYFIRFLYVTTTQKKHTARKSAMRIANRGRMMLNKYVAKIFINQFVCRLKCIISYLSFTHALYARFLQEPQRIKKKHR